MASLFEINREIQELWDSAIDPETGELDSMTWDRVDQLQLERDAKIENIACWIKNLRSDVAALKAEAKTMQERATIASRKADRLQEYLAAALAGEKFQTPRVAIGWRRSTAVKVEDPDLLPANFVREIVEKKPDLAGIKDALKAGVTVEGAELVECNNIQIR